MNLWLFVKRRQTIRLRWKLVRGLPRRVEESQKRGRQVLAHFLGVKDGVRTLVRVVAKGEFGERSGAGDGVVAGAEIGVYDESAVKDQEGVVDALEGVVVDPFIGEVQEHLRGNKVKQKSTFSRGFMIYDKILNPLTAMTVSLYTEALCDEAKMSDSTSSPSYWALDETPF